MLERILKEELDRKKIIYVTVSGEKLRDLADTDLRKHGLNTNNKEECMQFLIETEKHLNNEEFDRLYELTVGNINFPLYRITSADVNGYIIKYERFDEIQEFLVLSKLEEDEYKEVISLQMRGPMMSVSTKYEDGMPILWEEFPPHQTFEQEKLVKRIFELAGIKADP